jgi:hypothetical protein
MPVQHGVWHLVPGTLSPDKRRARVACDACGIEVERIHPFTRTVEQVEHTAAKPRRSR